MKISGCKIFEMNAEKNKFYSVVLAAVFVVTAVFGFSACWKKDSIQSGSLDVFSSDDTDEAVKIIEEANDELKKIKAIYRENEGKIVQIQTAMANRQNDEVKKIADDLVFQINDGITLGESAISKIEKAEKLDINETFRQYLELKKESLRTQINAFEYRRQAAQLLSRGFAGDPKEVEGIKAVFKEKELNFQKVWQEGRDQSQEANDFYKDAIKKSAQQN